MPIENKPTRAQIIDRERVDVKTELSKTDPWNQSGTINAELVAFGSRFSEMYEQLEIISVNRFITTMTDDNSIIEAGNGLGITQNPATGSSGSAIFTGTVGSIVTQGSELTASDNSYLTESSVTIINKNLNVASISRVGVVATVSTNDVHGFGSGMTITITGADQADYNGDFIISVTDADSFTYEVANSPVTPATGTIVASCDCGTTNVLSVDTGQDQNLIAGSQFVLSATVSGVDSSAYTDYTGVDGGADLETIDELQERIIFAQQNPSTPFNKTEIINKAKEITGVTRVWVYSPEDLNLTVTPSSIVSVNQFVTVTFSSAHGLFDGAVIEVSGANESDYNGTFVIFVTSATTVAYFVSGIANGTATGATVVSTGVVVKGQVSIYFVRDNDTSIIPSQNEINTVKDQILTIKPADINGEFDVIVSAPDPKGQDFNLSNLSPDTVGIRSSIETNLSQLFTDNDLGKSITENQYITAIQSSFDPETSSQLKYFDLAESGTILAEFNEILILGNVNIT